MYRTFTAVMFVAVYVAMMQSYQLGMDWLIEGQGLNPMLAFPGAVVLLVLGVFWLREFLLTFECVQQLVKTIEHITRAWDDLHYSTVNYCLSMANDPDTYRRLYREQRKLNRAALIRSLKRRWLSK